jgi:hypothetical protein
LKTVFYVILSLILVSFILSFYTTRNDDSEKKTGRGNDLKMCTQIIVSELHKMVHSVQSCKKKISEVPLRLLISALIFTEFSEIRLINSWWIFAFKFYGHKHCGLWDYDCWSPTRTYNWHLSLLNYSYLPSWKIPLYVFTIQVLSF